MIERPRAVFDTNIFVSAFLSRNPSSPTKELFRRWADDELTLLISDDLLDEILEKLTEKKVEHKRITELVTLLVRLAEWVSVPAAAVQRVVADDPDDDPVLALAIVGRADYLVTYDQHFDSLVGQGLGTVKITRALPLLRVLRGDSPAAP